MGTPQNHVNREINNKVSRKIPKLEDSTNIVQGLSYLILN